MSQVQESAPSPPPQTADAHGELVHRLTLLERACRESRESLCLHTEFARQLAQGKSGLIVPTGNVKPGPKGINAEFVDKKQHLKDASDQTLEAGVMHLVDVCNQAAGAVALARPILQRLGVKVL